MPCVFQKKSIKIPLFSTYKNYFQACDLGNKGFLTERDLNLALDRIMNQADKIEIKNIFGVLDSSSAKVNLKTFKEKVLQYVESKENELENSLNKEIADINDNTLLQSVNSQTENLNRISPFNPNLISSPVVGYQSNHSLHEETFESLGAESSNIHDLDEVDCFVTKSSRLRMSVRRNRRLSSKQSFCISESPSPTYNDDLECLKRELLDKSDQILFCQEELQNESLLVKTLEEKLENLENTNKELFYELDNSKINNKNLEAHMLFLEEKLVLEAMELENQKMDLAFEKEKLIKDKESINREKLKIDERYEELESLRLDLVSKNHILQSEVIELKGDNKTLQDDLETLKRLSEENINRLIMENTALKDRKTIKKNENEIKVESPETKRSRKPKRREYLFKILLRILIKSGLICIHECCAYLRGS